MRQAGFTLVELMIVVVIVAVLAVVAGGAYRRYSAQVRKGEVYSMFAEIRAKEEAYRTEFGTYLSSAGTDTTFFPVLGLCAAGENEPCPKVWNPPPAAWSQLNLSPGKQQLYCGYSVIAGLGGTAPAGTYGAAAYANTTPTTPWWYAVATCDNDGNAAVNAIFVTTADRDTTYEQDTNR